MNTDNRGKEEKHVQDRLVCQRNKAGPEAVLRIMGHGGGRGL